MYVSLTMEVNIRGVLTVLVICLWQCDGKISCLDGSGSPVDWFIVYKLPRDAKSSNQLIRDGVAHMYMDVNHQAFSLSQISLNESNQAVAFTLQQIYDNNESPQVVYMMYNDEFPDGRKTDSEGHTKGDVAFDADSGFWLIHSVPKFPDSASRSYVWPDNAVVFGQSMLCVSMKTSEFVKVGQQLFYNYPAVYDYNIPASFRAQFADFVSVSQGQHVEQSPWNHSVPLTSLGGQGFISFAKFASFGQDLYWYWVAPALGDDLYVETWLNAQSKLPSFCNGSYNVENVKSISFNDVLTFTSTKDHSKWAIGVNKKWTCIGDINRTGSQYKRGGGTVCVQIPAVWSAFSSTIGDIDRCN